MHNSWRRQRKRARRGLRRQGGIGCWDEEHRKARFLPMRFQGLSIPAQGWPPQSCDDVESVQGAVDMMTAELAFSLECKWDNAAVVGLVEYSVLLLAVAAGYPELAEVRGNLGAVAVDSTHFAVAEGDNTPSAAIDTAAVVEADSTEAGLVVFGNGHSAGGCSWYPSDLSHRATLARLLWHARVLS